jgi:Reverse transcriptase (RNA-dependent DNA polymerase)
MAVPSVKLSSDELDAALEYVGAAGLSDFFPRPFELEALRHSWPRVRSVLEGVDLLCYEPRECFEMIAPKQRCLVRPVHLLDPIDSILYAGLTLRLAPVIQQKRDRYQTQRVFSWHFNSASSGGRDTFRSDWDGYRERAEELCLKYKFVGTSDIVDFFPRVYLHRLQNALAALSGDEYGTKAIMKMVEAWAHGTSYGIPTGPGASNFLAEALLVEVDEYLLSCDVEFIRWVDDYLIFADSEHQVISGLYRLGSRLNHTQGLSLNAAKTRLRLCGEYLHYGLRRDDPTAELRQKIIDVVFGGAPYVAINYDALSDDEKQAIDKLDVEATLEGALEGDIVDLKSVKFILRVLSAFRRPDLVDPVLNNLHRLLPVADSVAKFFDVLDQVEGAGHFAIGTRILSYLTSGEFVPDFQAMWLLDPFTKSTNWNNLVELRKLARDAKNRFVRRQALLGIRQTGERSALLDAKSSLEDSLDWEQRAILYACSKLPKDECDAIITQSGGHGGNWTINDCLRKAVLSYLKASP